MFYINTNTRVKPQVRKETITLLSGELERDINNIIINELTTRNIYNYAYHLNMIIGFTYDYIAQQKNPSFETVIQPRAELERLKFKVVLTLMKAECHFRKQEDINKVICEALELISDRVIYNSQRSGVFGVMQEYFKTDFMRHHLEMRQEQLVQAILMLRDFKERDSSINTYLSGCSMEVDVESSCMLPPVLTRCPRTYGTDVNCSEAKSPNRFPALDLV